MGAGAPTHSGVYWGGAGVCETDSVTRKADPPQRLHAPANAGPPAPYTPPPQGVRSWPGTRARILATLALLRLEL